MQTLKLCKPYKICFPNKMTQGFHEGHAGVDYVAPYGTWLVAPCHGIITEISNVKMTGDNKDYERGYYIRIMSEDNVYLSYFHILPGIPVRVGDVVNQGDLIAQMGNSGYVISMGKYVHADDRLTKWKPGTHIHYEVFRERDNGERIYIDAREYTDWNIPVTYTIADRITAWMKILKDMVVISNT